MAMAPTLLYIVLTTSKIYLFFYHRSIKQGCVALSIIPTADIKATSHIPATAMSSRIAVTYTKSIILYYNAN